MLGAIIKLTLPIKFYKLNVSINKMNQKELSELTDQELLDEAKEMKSFSFTNALIIGFLMGVVFYSVVKNTWGIFTIIPLFFVYKLINDPKNKRYKALEKLLKERNLK